MPRQLLIAESTKNIGGGDASASTTRYYLSRDRHASDNDILLDATHAVPSLAATTLTVSSNWRRSPAARAPGSTT